MISLLIISVLIPRGYAVDYEYLYKMIILGFK